MTTPPLPPRFHDVAVLGAGAFGQVFRAIDPEGRPVAVKTLAAPLALQPEQTWQFKAEFRKLARLDHPAFPRAYEEGLLPSGEPFYTMALVVGRPPRGPLPAAEVRRVLQALAEALAYLHRAGQVHGDLKPENVLVAPDGTVSLLDLGLMAARGEARSAIAGTLTYMAPEVLRRAPADPRADLYALGAIGYELSAGRPPFTGAPAELVRAHLQEPPPPLPASADPALTALLFRLLEKDPARRPASAEAVLAALAGEPEPAASRALQEGPWLGREAPLEAWREVLASGGWLTVAGAAGAGKSRALDEFRLLAQMAGRTWVGVGCGGDVPAGAVRALVRQVVASAGAPPSPLLAAWLAGELPEALLALEPAARQMAVVAEVSAALTRAAETLGGLAVGLDDWHAADEASRELITALRRRPSAIAWALATEADEAAIPLRTLTAAETEALLAARLGAPVPPALLAYLTAAAQGNPGLLALLLEHGLASGQLTGDAEGWHFADAGTLPRSAAAVWQARLAPLSPEARRLAAVVAVAAPAGALPVPLVLSAAALEAPDEALSALSASGLVTVAQGEVRLAVAGTAGVVLEGVSAERRADWAGTLARAVLGDTPLAELPLDTLSRGAWLALAGDDGHLALASASEAGRRALAHSVAREALKLLDAAAARLPEDAPAPVRLGVWLPRAEAERFADRLADAVTDYEAAAGLASALDQRADAARALIGLAKCRQMQGAYAPALEALARAADFAAGVDPAQAARALASEARIRVFQGQSDRAIACCAEAVTLARAANDRAILAVALNLQGVLTVQAHPEAPEPGLAMLDEALGLSTAVGDRLGVGTALENLGNAYLALGELPRAAESFGRYVAILQEAGQETDALGARFNQAIVAAERGELAQAVAVAESVAALAAKVGRKFPLAAAQTVLGQAAWRQGRPQDALPALEAALETASAIQNLYLEEHVRLYRLEAFLAIGEAEAADAESAALAALVEKTDHAEGRAHLACCLAERRLLAGQPELALSAVADQLEAPNRVIAHRARRVFARAALQLQQAEEALAMARSALELAEGWDSGWHMAADRLLVARALLLGGERGEALTLARAVLEFSGPDAHPYARAGAAMVLAEFGIRADDRQAASAAREASEALLSPLDPAARRRLLAAQDLEGLESLAAPPRAAGAGAIEALAFAGSLERIALETDEAGIAQAALDAAIALIGADRGYLLAYEGGRLRHVTTRALDYQAEVQAHFSRSIAEHVLFNGEAVYVMDASADAAWSASRSVAALALKTVVCLPMGAGEDLLGVLYMDREALEPVLSPADLTMLTALGTFSAACTFRARSRAEARRAVFCADWAAELAGEVGAARVRQALLRTALAASGAERGFWLVRDDAGAFEALGPDGAAVPDAGISRGVAERVYERREALTVLDASTDAEWEARLSVQALGLRTIWCLPVGAQLLYLDTSQLTQADPMGVLRDLEALVAYAAPLLG